MDLHKFVDGKCRRCQLPESTSELLCWFVTDEPQDEASKS